MDFAGVFEGINPSKLLVYTSLLLFSVLLTLRLDEIILCSYWFVFIPLWIWKLAVFSGAAVGAVVWYRHPESSLDLPQVIQFRAMITSTALHVLLFLFEMLACIKLGRPDSAVHYWSLVFIPIFLISFLSHFLCVWACRNERAFEFELFFAVNTLQLVFLAIRLDEIISWNWVFVFVPLWITLLVCFVFTVYIFLLARSQEVMPEQRNLTFKRAVNYTCVIVPFVLFLALLTEKLDSAPYMPFSVAAIPLYVSLVALGVTSLSAEGGNIWWFGMRKDFCRILLDSFPLLQEYGNVSYRMHEEEEEANRNRDRSLSEEKPGLTGKRSRKMPYVGPPVVPAYVLTMPD